MKCPSRQERSEIAARLRNRRREMESEKPPADPIFAAFVYLTNVMGAVRVGEGGNLFNRAHLRAYRPIRMETRRRGQRAAFG